MALGLSVHEARWGLSINSLGGAIVLLGSARTETTLPTFSGFRTDVGWIPLCHAGASLAKNNRRSLSKQKLRA